jgi:hypothetical protein
MTVSTRELDLRARDHLEARSAQDKAALTEVQILVSVSNYLEKPEDVGSYLLAFETAYKEKAFNPDSLKVIKSNIKTFLEFSKGWRKEQADWTAEQVASESERIASDAKSLQQLSKGARQSLKDGSTKDAGKDDLTPPPAPTVDEMTAKLAKLAQSFADAGATQSDIQKAIAALAKLAK